MRERGLLSPRHLYMRARHSEPWTGRFVTEDPARDGWNWFVYCGSDPVNRIDANCRKGLIPTTVATIIFVLTNSLGAYLGMLTGYFGTVAALQEIDPNFRPTFDWLASMIGLLPGAASLYGPKANVGGGLGWGRLATCVGRIGVFGFVFGFVVGAYLARIAYESYYAENA